mmetsp:Transcript_16895/g.33791  ORF Transcript_16895/g.33791 Transcript_16895/m.33791 type:complete len:204 (-) Transcript_16895:1028-1639(-)
MRDLTPSPVLADMSLTEPCLAPTTSTPAYSSSRRTQVSALRVVTVSRGNRSALFTPRTTLCRAPDDAIMSFMALTGPEASKSNRSTIRTTTLCSITAGVRSRVIRDTKVEGGMGVPVVVDVRGVSPVVDSEWQRWHTMGLRDLRPSEGPRSSLGPGASSTDEYGFSPRKSASTSSSTVHSDRPPSAFQAATRRSTSDIFEGRR